MQEEQKKHNIFPAFNDIFRAFAFTPFDKIKVVILGQDPYHWPGQANGLAFSVQEGVKKPPSLLNIYKEVERDIGIQLPEHGNLEGWAQQGVLLLNTVLTVRERQPGSHQNRGWEKLTDHVISKISEGRGRVAFMLWGKTAESKVPWLDLNKHLVLRAAHPSPLSAHRGFHGCGHFSAANHFLEQHGQTPIDWNLPT